MKFLIGENFQGAILRALERRYPDFDAIRVQDTRQRLVDPKVLEWAAQEGRILLTHDRKTMLGHVYDRVDAGLPMPGVIFVDVNTPIGITIEDIVLVIEDYNDGDLENVIRYIPLT